MFRMLPATLALATGLGAGAAHAAIIDTFSFAQTGFYDPNAPGSVGTLSGTFTGTVEASGYIQLSDLNSFNVVYSEGQASSFGYAASFFSFNPNSASTLDFEATIGIFGVACSGAVAAFGYDRCNTGGIASAVDGYALGAYTGNLATVTLVSSIIQIPPQPLPQPGPTPYPYPTPQPLPTPVSEPGTLALFGAALAGFGLIATTWRRRAFE